KLKYTLITLIKN
ncbi:hypothetical protein MPH_02942, partial [Macrophomina phaseolina MS6]